jgi:hypothetical protein
MFYSIYQYYVNNENIQQTSFFKPFTVASMLILLTAVNEGIGVCFVGAFDDIKVSKILEIPKQVRPIGILKLVSQIISINTYIIGLLGYYIEDFLPRIGIANSNSVVQFFLLLFS